MTTALDRKDFLRIFAVAGAGLALGVEFAPAQAEAAAGAVVRAAWPGSKWATTA